MIFIYGRALSDLRDQIEQLEKVNSEAKEELRMMRNSLAEAQACIIEKNAGLSRLSAQIEEMNLTASQRLVFDRATQVRDFADSVLNETIGYLCDELPLIVDCFACCEVFFVDREVLRYCFDKCLEVN